MSRWSLWVTKLSLSSIGAISLNRKHLRSNLTFESRFMSLFSKKIQDLWSTFLKIECFSRVEKAALMKMSKTIRVQSKCPRQAALSLPRNTSKSTKTKIWLLTTEGERVALNTTRKSSQSRVAVSQMTIHWRHEWFYLTVMAESRSSKSRPSNSIATLTKTWLLRT